jgi:hypothetical protein
MEVKISELVSNNTVMTLKKIAASDRIKDAKTVYSIVKFLRRSDKEYKELQDTYNTLWNKLDRTKYADMSDEDKAIFDNDKSIEIEKEVNGIAEGKKISLDISLLNSQVLIDAGFTALDLFAIDKFVDYETGGEKKGMDGAM